MIDQTQLFTRTEWNIWLENRMHKYYNTYTQLMHIEDKFKQVSLPWNLEKYGTTQINQSFNQVEKYSQSIN